MVVAEIIEYVSDILLRSAQDDDGDKPLHLCAYRLVLVCTGKPGNEGEFGPCVVCYISSVVVVYVS